MASTGYDHGQADLARGYLDSYGKSATPVDPLARFAAGALYSTVKDLYRCGQALYTEKPVPQKALEAMFIQDAAKYHTRCHRPPAKKTELEDKSIARIGKGWGAWREVVGGQSP